MNVRPKVLVVDDEADTKNFILNLLRQQNYEVLTAPTGEDALIFLEGDHNIDVILLDVMMPGLDGFEVLEILKSTPETKHIKVIMLTAINAVEDKVKAFSAGAADYLVKPCEKAELLARLKTQIDLKQAEEKLSAMARFPTESPAPVLRISAEGKIMYINRAGAKFLHSLSDDTGLNTPADWQPLISQVLESNERLEMEYEVGACVFTCMFVPLVDLGYVNVYGTDITELKRVETELQAYREHLETLVHQRTAELAQANEILKEQITERQRAEKALKQAHDELEIRVEQRTFELRKANDQLEALYKVGQMITAQLQLDVVLEVIARSTANLLETDTGVILLLDEATNTLSIKGAYGLSERVVKGTRDRVGESIAGRVVQTGEPLIANDLLHDPRFYNPSTENEGLLACASVPLVVGEKIIGTLDVHSKTNRFAFNQTHIQILNMLASQAAIAIENARLYQQAQQEIAERKRTQKALKIYTEKLQQSNRELEEFAYVASHDLQEPLRKVQAFSDRLQTKYGAVLDDQGRDYLARMQGAAARMRNLINGLLTYSRVTTKAQPFAPVDLAQVTQEVVCDLETQIEQSGGRVEVGALPTLEADPTQIRQLLQNLISNALKFHRAEETPLVKVQATPLNSDGPSSPETASEAEWYQISVSDNGIGFEEQYLNRIFQVFQRLHGRSEYEGTGIGLATCRKIAERHGGCITAKSTPGQGAAFVVTLPLKQTLGGNQE